MPTPVPPEPPVITGLLFHTNSDETYYTFIFHPDTSILELEIAQCPGIYDGAMDFQIDYEINRTVLGYMCDTMVNVMKNEILYKLYTFSKILSIPSPNKLTTKIIWKCMRFTKKYLEFDVNICKTPIIPVYDVGFDHITKIRTIKLAKLVNDQLEEEINAIETDLACLEKVIDQQKMKTDAFMEGYKDIFPDDILDRIRISL